MGSFCLECADGEEGHEPRACRKENRDLAWPLYLGSWEYFTAEALFFSINAFQTCSLLGAVMCGSSPLCRAHALARCVEDVSIMILLPW